MYSAFWLWAIAQALLLPNWVAGFAGLVGFGTLYFGRVAREERMMLQTFGDSYREYMARTGRVFPWILRSRSRPILICGTAKSTLEPKSLNFRAILATYGKKRLSGLPTPRSIHCRRGERSVSSMRVG